MDETALSEMSAVAIHRAIADGRTTAEAVASACLERIAERDGLVRAWTAVEPRAVLLEARALDRGPSRGALHGVPFGVKDVIDTADLPTGMGSVLYDGYRPVADAACVATARAAGGLVLGKTRTAEFAGADPTITRNPLRPEHTPGGSSSGSGAAVADRHVPLAYGTQTGGSVLRPASFCGVVGFKPSFGAISTAGVKPAAVSFDTIGLIARVVEDVELFFAVLTADEAAPAPPPEAGPCIALARTPLWERAREDTRAAVEGTAAALAASGAQVTEADLPPVFARLPVVRAVVNAYERAHALAHEWRTGRDRMAPNTFAVCERGFAIPRAAYVAAFACIEEARAGIAATFEGVDALLTPTVDGEAPEGLDWAGPPAFQEPWTLLHVPAITLPLHTGPSGLSVGIQFVGPRHGDRRLLAVARWVEAALAKG